MKAFYTLIILLISIIGYGQTLDRSEKIYEKVEIMPNGNKKPARRASFNNPYTKPFVKASWYIY